MPALETEQLEQEEIVTIQQGLVETGYDIGQNPDGSPEINGEFTHQLRMAIEEFLEDFGIGAGNVTLQELFASLQNMVETQQIAKKMDMGGADVTIAGDPGFIQENVASIGVPMPEPQYQPAPGVAPQQPQMGTPGQVA